jgi:hypothetical protein
MRSIDESIPTKEKYIVVTVEFYKNPIRHFVVTPFNKEKIIYQLKYLTKSKEVGGEFIGSGEVASLKPGMIIKSYFLNTRDNFKKKTMTTSAFKKKREAAFFPHQHLIKNEHVEKVLHALQIYAAGFVPSNPDTCFVHSLRGQVPDGMLQKIKRDVRSEFVSLTTVKKVAKNNKLCITVKLERNQQKEAVKFNYGEIQVKHL